MDSCASLLKSIDQLMQKADDEWEDYLDELGFVDPARTVQEKNALEEKIARALKVETKLILAALASCATLSDFSKKLSDIIKEDVLHSDINKIMQTEMAKFVPKISMKYSARIDPALSINSISMRTGKWIEGWSAKLGKLMKLDTYTTIEKLLKQNLKEGRGVADLARAIKNSGIREEYYRAQRVAVTETLRAHSYAHYEATMQNPAVEMKIWRHTGGQKNEPRYNHVAMDGQQVPKNEPFELHGSDGGVYYPMIPQDSSLPPGESISCHCNYQDVVSEKMLGLPLAERQALQQEAIEEMGGYWTPPETYAA